MALIKNAVKAVATMNVATAVRLARCGPRDAARRLRRAYQVIDPFGEPTPPNATIEEGERLLAQLPIARLAELVTSRPLVQIEGTHSYEDGSLPTSDALALLTLAKDRAPQVVLEIGTFNGATTRLLARNLPDATIHTIDLPEGVQYRPDDAQPLPKDDYHLIAARRVGERYRSDPAARNVVQHFGDTAVWDFGTVAGATFFFVDGSHTYEYVKSDTLKAIASAGGRPITLLWHDCDRSHPDVIRWLLEFRADGHDVRWIEGTNLAVAFLGCSAE